ncbi:MAG: ABC transporter substrate-binding protein [Acidobacteriota bacterium]
MRRAFCFRSTLQPLRPSAGPAAVVLGLLLLAACGAEAPREARWVSLAPSATEVLFAVGAGPQVAGVCAPAGWPPEASGLPAVASWERVDVEAVAALRPRACFTVEGMNPPEALETLRRLGIAVHVFPARNLEDIPAMLEAVGRLTGHGEEGDEAARRFREEAARLTTGLPAEKVPAAVVVGLDPLVAAGGGTFLDGLLGAAGFRNVFSPSGEAYPVVSLEDLVRRGPSVLVLPAGEVAEARAGALGRDLAALLGRPVRTVTVPADLLVRPGPRSLSALALLAAARREGAGP